MARPASVRRHDHSRDPRPMADRFPPKQGTDSLTIHAPDKFDAAEVLRRSGLRFRNEARAAGQDVGGVGSALESIGAGDLSGQAGNLLVIFLGGILGLLMLNMLLSNRGSSAVSIASKYLGGGINRLVSPNDPLSTPRSPVTTVDVNPATNPNAAGPPKPTTTTK